MTQLRSVVELVPRGPQPIDVDRVGELLRELLTAAGEDPAREGLLQAPQRVCQLWTELLSGVGKDAAAPLVASTMSIAEGTDQDLLPSGIVMVRDIAFRSVCEHHFLPFAGRAHIAYLPRERVVGLGAFPRMIDTLAARLQLQERLGEEIASTLDEALDARGVVVVIDAVHHCVTMRAREQAGSSTVTVAARGELADPTARAEAMALIVL